MDRLDRAILDILKKNARASYAYMARTLGVSEGTVRKRVKSLLERGFIELFTIEEGNGIRALILINAKTNVDCPLIAKRLTEIDHVEKVYEVSGQYDIVAIIFARTTQEINDTLEKIRKVDGVERTYTCIVLKSHYPGGKETEEQ